MTTHAIESRAATNDSLTAPDLTRVTPAPADVRAKFASLPVPLRVAARHESESSILIEGDLPWLAVGTSVGLELPDGVHKTGRVQSFDIDLTPEGSARLRIFADLSPSDRRPSESAQK